MEKGAGGSALGLQSDTGGNPQEYREAVVTLEPGSKNLIAGVLGFHRHLEAVHDPSVSGEIQSISFSLDSKLIAPLGLVGHTVGPALRQNGLIYAFVVGQISEENWTARAASELQARDFGRVLGGNGGQWTDGRFNPDFTASGSPIEFGFFTSRASQGVDDPKTFGFDNWVLTISPVPAPPTPIPGIAQWGMAALITLVLVLTLWRRRANDPG